MDIGGKIRHLRERSGLTQEQLAERLGVSRQVVTKWENGSGVPKIENLKALADHFHVTVDELIGRTEVTEGNPEEQYEKVMDELRQHSQAAVDLFDQAIRTGAKLSKSGRKST